MRKARYVSKDPIGLFGGLHTTKYVSDPNLWVDRMGLVAEKDFPDAKKAYQEGIDAQFKEYNKLKQKQESTFLGSINKTAKEKLGSAVNNINKGGERLAQVRSPSSRASAMVKCAAGHCYPAQLDYIVCSAGSSFTPSGSIAINMHNGNIFAGGGVSAGQVKNIYAMKHTPIPDRRKLSFNASVGCMIFSIQNLGKGLEDLKRAKAVDAALDGASFSATIGGLLQFGVDKSLVDPSKMFERDENGRLKLSEAQKKLSYSCWYRTTLLHKPIVKGLFHNIISK